MSALSALDPPATLPSMDGSGTTSSGTGASGGTGTFSRLRRNVSKEDNKHKKRKPPRSKSHKFKIGDFIRRRKADSIDQYYVVGELLGEGQFGEVYQGVLKSSSSASSSGSKSNSRDVRAVKKIHKALLDKYEHEEVLNEFATLKTMDHPNILKMYEFFEDKEDYWFVTEMCRGGELLDELERNGPLTEAGAALVMMQVLSCVHYCHTQKHIVHRDLKLENVLLEAPPGQSDLHNPFIVKVIDFGLAIPFTEEQVLTQPVGSMHYIAPEVLEQEYGHKCDIWSCGIIAYVLLCGYAPFDAPNDMQMRELIMMGNISFDDPIWHDNVSEEAKDFIRLLCTYEPEKRPEAETCLQHPWIQKAHKQHATRLQAQKLYADAAVKVMHNLRAFECSSKLKQAACAFLASQIIVPHCHDESDVGDDESHRITIISEIFRSMDVNHDGSLCVEELDAGFRDFLPKEKVALPEVEDIFTRVDFDGTGTIEFSEFVVAALGFQESTPQNEQLIKQAFQNMLGPDERNKPLDSQYITRDLIRQEMVHFYGDDVEDDVIEYILEGADHDEDGQISWADFQAMMATKAKYKPASGIKRTVTSVQSAVTRTATKTGRTMTSAAKTTGKTIINTPKTVAAGVTSAAKTTGNAIVKTPQAVAAGVTSAAKTTGKTIVKTPHAVAAGVTSAAKTTGKTIASTPKTMVSAAKTTGKTIVKTPQAVAAGMTSAAKTTGKTIVKTPHAVAVGVTSGGKMIINTPKNVAAGMTSGAKIVERTFRRTMSKEKNEKGSSQFSSGEDGVPMGPVRKGRRKSSQKSTEFQQDNSNIGGDSAESGNDTSGPLSVDEEANAASESSTPQPVKQARSGVRARLMSAMFEKNIEKNKAEGHEHFHYSAAQRRIQRQKQQQAHEEKQQQLQKEMEQNPTIVEEGENEDPASQADDSTLQVVQVAPRKLPRTRRLNFEELTKKATVQISFDAKSLREKREKELAELKATVKSERQFVFEKKENASIDERKLARQDEMQSLQNSLQNQPSAKDRRSKVEGEFRDSSAKKAEELRSKKNAELRRISVSVSGGLAKDKLKIFGKINQSFSDLSPTESEGAEETENRHSYRQSRQPTVSPSGSGETVDNLVNPQNEHQSSRSVVPSVKGDDGTKVAPPEGQTPSPSPFQSPGGRKRLPARIHSADAFSKGPSIQKLDGRFEDLQPKETRVEDPVDPAKPWARNQSSKDMHPEETHASNRIPHTSSHGSNKELGIVDDSESIPARASISMGSGVDQSSDEDAVNLTLRKSRSTESLGAGIQTLGAPEKNTKSAETIARSQPAESIDTTEPSASSELTEMNNTTHDMSISHFPSWEADRGKGANYGMHRSFHLSQSFERFQELTPHGPIKPNAKASLMQELEAVKARKGSETKSARAIFESNIQANKTHGVRGSFWFNQGDNGGGPSSSKFTSRRESAKTKPPESETVNIPNPGLSADLAPSSSDDNGPVPSKASTSTNSRDGAEKVHDLVDGHIGPAEQGPPTSNDEGKEPLPSKPPSRQKSTDSQDGAEKVHLVVEDENNEKDGFAPSVDGHQPGLAEAELNHSIALIDSQAKETDGPTTDQAELHKIEIATSDESEEPRKVAIVSSLPEELQMVQPNSSTEVMQTTAPEVAVTGNKDSLVSASSEKPTSTEKQTKSLPLTASRRPPVKFTPPNPPRGPRAMQSSPKPHLKSSDK